MQIERVDLWITRLQLVRPFVTSSSRREHLDHILVKAYADGLAGWGECASPSDPYYCEETTETCWHMLTDFLVPAVLGRPWTAVEDVAGFYGKVRRNNFAKAGLEMACWDLLARARGLPLHALLGGTRAEILSGVSLGIEQDPGRLLALVDRYLGEGYRRIKLKIGPGKDVDVVAEVRKQHPDVPLMVDANSAYTLADADRLAALDEHDLLMIEQPLPYDDLVDHAELQRRLRTPICLDESVPSLAAARAAVALGSGRIVNIKPGRVGGLTVARAIHDLCRESGWPVWCGGMLETGIGRAHNVALASLPGFTLPGDISASARYFHRDIVEPEFVVNDDSTMTVPTGPGIGVAVVHERLAAATQRRLTVV